MRRMKKRSLRLGLLRPNLWIPRHGTFLEGMRAMKTQASPS
jgi:hypothetical protein